MAHAVFLREDTSLDLSQVCATVAVSGPECRSESGEDGACRSARPLGRGTAVRPLVSRTGRVPTAWTYLGPRSQRAYPL